MDRKQKRAASSSSTTSSEPPQNKAARPSSPAADESSWCTLCWKHPDEKCSGDEHRLLPLQDAKTEARNAVGDAHLALESRHKRLNAIEEAGEPTVLKLSIPSKGLEGGGLYVAGGLMMIRMAVTGALTEEEKEQVIEAITEQSLVFELDADALEGVEEVVAVTARLDKMCMASVLEKLPLCVVGQQLPAGTILYQHDPECDWKVYDSPFVINKRHVQLKVRVFGRVTNDFYLRAQRDDFCWNRRKYGPPPDEPVDVEVEDAQFVDGSQMKARCSQPGRVTNSWW